MSILINLLTCGTVRINNMNAQMEILNRENEQKLQESTGTERGGGHGRERETQKDSLAQVPREKGKGKIGVYTGKIRLR